MDIQPIKDWDIMAIIYSLVASVIFIFALKWLGFTRRIWNFFKNRKALLKYKKNTIEDCNSLIVVGKRKGFVLNDVYVALDLAQSDLAQENEFEYERLRSYVLLGGPGAGKSTTAKNMVIEHFNNHITRTVPFFIRLKDYNGDQTLFSYIVRKFESYGFVNANETVKKIYQIIILYAYWMV